MKDRKPPYLGAAYYPEDWDDDEIDYDISMMKKAGVNVARIAEFAWKKMEPQPGVYDFGWLHRVVDKLKAADIAVVLGTPTATPPQWLLRMYPDAAVQNVNGRQASHGGRRHCCSNNPHYRAACAGIAEAMAKEFADDENVIGWQIDNEIYTWGLGCFCPECTAKFRLWLRDKFGTVEELNRRWNLNVFSQIYDRFEDVVPPRDAWHNPHLCAEWTDFQNESHVSFVHMQADILRRYVKVPIGTDTMPFNAMNYRRMTEKLDVVQFNHYNEPSTLWKECMWFDFLRTLKDRPFWNTETQTCWNGGTEVSSGIKPEGFCRINSFLPIALGGEANMYWVWRTHWGGHELMHGSVLDACGRPMHIFGEVQDTARIYEKAADYINGTKVKTEVAFLYTSANWRMLGTQRAVHSVNETTVDGFYKPLADLGLRPDVIDGEEPLDRYKLLIAPLAFTIEENDLPQRIMQWVRDGGTWVAGPLTDIRTADGTRYQHKPFGILEELTGAKWEYFIPDTTGTVTTAWANSGEAFHGGTWYDVYEENENALVRITGGHSAINGKPCVLDVPVGKGHVILLGTFPADAELKEIYKIACGHAGISCGNMEGEIMVSPRCGDRGECVMLCEYGNREGAYHFDGTMTDILTGETYNGFAKLAPYQIMVLVK